MVRIRVGTDSLQCHGGGEECSRTFGVVGHDGVSALAVQWAGWRQVEQDGAFQFLLEPQGIVPFHEFKLKRELTGQIAAQLLKQDKRLW
jgi:hypothetical protein